MQEGSLWLYIHVKWINCLFIYLSIVSQITCVMNGAIFDWQLSFWQAMGPNSFYTTYGSRWCINNMQQYDRNSSIGTKESLLFFLWQEHANAFLTGNFKGASGGPRHCIWTPDCPLKYLVTLMYRFKGIPSTWLQKLYVSIGIGIVHFRSPDVPLIEFWWIVNIQWIYLY